MQKFSFQGLKTLDHLKTLQASVSRASKPSPVTTSANADSVSSGSFASLKIATEQLVEDQAGVRTYLDLANSKLTKSAEHVSHLEQKLQTVLHENTEFRVKQEEHEKLWQGLVSKLSSTKNLCDQLTETLQALTCQVHIAEEERQSIEEKLSSNSAALDNLNDQMRQFSLKLRLAEETIGDRDEELKNLKSEREEMKALHQDQHSQSMKIIEEKDALMHSIETELEANRLTSEELKSKLDAILVDLRQNEEVLAHMKSSLDELQRENTDLHAANKELADKLARSMHEKQNLSDTVSAYASELIDLDKKSLAFSHGVTELFSRYETLSELYEEDKDLVAKVAQKKYDEVHQKYVQIISEKDEVDSVNKVFKDQVYELQRAQESIIVQHAEECHSKEEKIRQLESQLDELLLQKKENQSLIAELEEKTSKLSDSLKSSEDKTNALSVILSKLESDNKEGTETLQTELQKKADELVQLQEEFGKRGQQVELLEQQLHKLDDDLKDKEQLVVQFREREKHLEDQRAETQASLAAAETTLGEAKKQYDSMLETKQMELSRHFKEISQRNDQAINDIRKKFELEKQGILASEKEKADKFVAETEKKYEQQLAQCQKESKTRLAHIQEAHAAMIRCMKEEQETKESSLRSVHFDELRRIELQAENELREKIKVMRNEHEAQMKALSLQHEDECKQLQEQLEVQRSKEERQRALLELQWKVMGTSQEDQEVNSKKEYSMSSIRMREPHMRKRRIHTSSRGHIKAKGQSPLATEQSPISTLLRKVEKDNAGRMMDMSKHSQKVTRHEYEVETNNGGTITKRRKTKSTVMYGEPRSNKRTPRASPPLESVKGTAPGGNVLPSNIGDLFTEGSLNPYADDPYAFD